MPRRIRSKRKRWVKKFYGLTRREIGAIGAGHMDAPAGYFQRLYQAKATPGTFVPRVGQT